MAVYLHLIESQRRYCAMPRSSKDFDTGETGGPQWPCIL